jgi:hypothetical protein
MNTKFWLENLKVRDHLEDQDVDGKIIIKMYLLELGWECFDWIHLVSETDQ